MHDYLDKLRRGQVHRDRGRRDYADAWKEPAPSQFDERWVEMLASLFQRPYRDSRCLHPAWQLLEDCNDAWAVRIRDEFLAEFPKMLDDTACSEHSVAQALAHQDNFARCPRDPNDDRQTVSYGLGAKGRARTNPETPRLALVPSSQDQQAEPAA